MNQPIDLYKLTLAMIRSELSTNAFVMTLYHCGFTIEHNLSDLSSEIMELIGFYTHPHSDRDRDDLLDFYVQNLDACTDAINRVSTAGEPNRPSLEEITLQFYNILLAEKQAREKLYGGND